MILRPRPLRGARLLLGALALLLSCRGNPASFGDDDAGSTGTNDGAGTLTCSSMSDCGGTGICMGGVCVAVTPCTSEEECAGTGGVCHSTRGYCVECDGRHAGECPEGEVCQFDFTCVPLGGSDGGVGDAGVCSGSCTDRTNCGAGQVCTNGECCAPPPRCTRPQDCPANRPECNGATGECFGGDDCIEDSDCDDKPNCEMGACFCDAPAPGNPGVCLVRPDQCQNDSDCMANQVCLLSASPRRCLDAPSCTSDMQCASIGLVCDLDMASPSYQRCRNGQACTTGGNECNPQTQACMNGVCVVQNCVNTPSLCVAPQVCETSTGQCITNPIGPCPNGDTDCQAGYFCDTSLNPQECRLGCRDNNDCPGGVCNASHACEGGMGMPGQLCSPCMDDSDCPAGTSCTDGLPGKLCYESCNSFLGQDCMINPMASCVITVCSCLGF